MLKISYRKEKRGKASEVLDNLIKQKSIVLIIHYSCESFFDTGGKSPRITSIAVRFFGSGQSKSFSIHKIAEKEGLSLDQIEEHYDRLEKEMLRAFFSFVKKHKQSLWVHWNMRDANYGFEAITHRYEVLGGKPEQFPENLQFNLSLILWDKYGEDYIGHPRMKTLCEKNTITLKEFLSGAEEADCFNKKDYVKLHQSTLRKVDALATVLEKSADNSLKTDANFFQIYGISLQGLHEMRREHWLFALICTLVGIFFSLLLTFIAHKFDLF